MRDDETKKETDWLGREKEVHYHDGEKIGETRFSQDWLGNAKQEHFDASGDKIGETHKGTDWLGNERAEHSDAQGQSIGHSHNREDFWGRSLQEHHNTDDEKVGSTKLEHDWIGQSHKTHQGQYFKANIPSESDYSSSNASSSHEDENGCCNDFSIGYPENTRVENSSVYYMEESSLTKPEPETKSKKELDGKGKESSTKSPEPDGICRYNSMIITVILIFAFLGAMLAGWCLFKTPSSASNQNTVISAMQSEEGQATLQSEVEEASGSLDPDLQAKIDKANEEWSKILDRLESSR